MRLRRRYSGNQCHITEPERKRIPRQHYKVPYQSTMKMMCKSWPRKRQFGNNRQQLSADVTRSAGFDDCMCSLGSTWRCSRPYQHRWVRCTWLRCRRTGHMHLALGEPMEVVKNLQAIQLLNPRYNIESVSILHFRVSTNIEAHFNATHDIMHNLKRTGILS